MAAAAAVAISPITGLNLHAAASFLVPSSGRCAEKGLFGHRVSRSDALPRAVRPRTGAIGTSTSFSEPLFVLIPLRGFHGAAARRGTLGYDASTGTLDAQGRRSFSSLSLGARKRLEKLEKEASDPERAADERWQGGFMKTLVSMRVPQHYIVQRFETQPQLASLGLSPAAHASAVARIQSNPDCLRAYLAALNVDTDARERVVRVVAGSVTSDSAGSPSLASSSGARPELAEVIKSAIARDPVDPKVFVSEPGKRGRAFWVRGPFSALASALSPSSSGQGSYGSSSPPPPPPGSSEPLQISISESWTWAGMVRRMMVAGVGFLVLMTGLSVVFESQGGRGPGAMQSHEVEPYNQPAIRFNDVQGVDEAKDELQEIVEFLREPKKFMEIGGKLPKGVLLYGPPGTGKTHLARAIAGEAGVPFFYMSGSEFDELYVGVGARRVRDLFKSAKKKAPCIVFIDELDAVGSKRSARDQSYMRQTLNQLLVELDGFSATEGIILIGATNTPEALDKALTRPGRFDRMVNVPLPDVRGRSKILEVHMKGVTVDPTVKPDVIAKGTPGFSGADLANLVNQAAIRASKEGAKWVRMPDLEWAKDKIMMGAERRSAVISENDKKVTAYHEGGHALVALYTTGAHPLHKVTVMPRGSALGITSFLPNAEHGMSKRELFASMDVSMGGRAAEELIFGGEEVTTGASSDFSKATSMARSMVLQLGMNDKLGPVYFRDDDLKNLSSEYRLALDNEIAAYVNSSYQRAITLLKSHEDELHLLAKALIEYETLSQDEVRKVIKGESLPKDEQGLKIEVGSGKGEKEDSKDKEKEKEAPKKGPKVPGLQGA